MASFAVSATPSTICFWRFNNQSVPFVGYVTTALAIDTTIAALFDKFGSVLPLLGTLIDLSLCSAVLLPGFGIVPVVPRGPPRILNEFTHSVCRLHGIEPVQGLPEASA